MNRLGCSTSVLRISHTAMLTARGSGDSPRPLQGTWRSKHTAVQVYRSSSSKHTAAAAAASIPQQQQVRDAPGSDATAATCKSIVASCLAECCDGQQQHLLKLRVASPPSACCHTVLCPAGNLLPHADHMQVSGFQSLRIGRNSTYTYCPLAGQFCENISCAALAGGPSTAHLTVAYIALDKVGGVVVFVTVCEVQDHPNGFSLHTCHTTSMHDV